MAKKKKEIKKEGRVGYRGGKGQGNGEWEKQAKKKNNLMLKCEV